MSPRRLRLLLLFSVAVLACCCSTPASAAVCSPAPTSTSTDDRPIIGLLVQDVWSDPLFPPSMGRTYLPASYVKWVEAAGARVAPVFFHNASDADSVATLRRTFCSVNGLLLPGGDYNLTGTAYEATTQQLLAWAAQASAGGDYFPVWGTCQGFEQLAIVFSANGSILTPHSADGVSLPLNLTAAGRRARMYSGLTPRLMEVLQTRNVTENLHVQGVSPTSYAASGKLSSLFEVLSTNVDASGREFISSMEARDLPIYGTQFHPERNAAEWNPAEPIDHSADAVRITQDLGAFLVAEARKSSHRFATPEKERNALIYSFGGPADTRVVNPAYVQTYFFDR